MTTKITVDAHAGWCVEVQAINPANNEVEMSWVVEPMTVRDFYVFDSRQLIITEIKK